MSRFNPHHDANAVLSTAADWRDRCFAGDGSILSEGEHLWTTEHLDELDRVFVQNVDEGDGTFLEKLQGQLQETSPAGRHLMAEAIWILLLFPSNVSAVRKRETVLTVWSWGGEDLPPGHPRLTDTVLQRMHLLDVFILDFCGRIAGLLRGGAIRTYQVFEDDLSALRGRLRLAEQIRRTAAERNRLRCAFDELSPDNPYNQALKAVLARLLPQAMGPDARAAVSGLLHRLRQYGHRRGRDHGRRRSDGRSDGGPGPSGSRGAAGLGWRGPRGRGRCGGGGGGAVPAEGTGVTAEIIAWLVAIGSAVAALVGVFLKGQATGAARERNRQLEQQVRATTERANADRDAGRAADPVGELQRDWRRG